ncbi:hypothetical protein AVEN_257430-1 [Araneus ventricosus]|uniref:Uncharacterized protein n=1 Tax=Araneus ventricosus TaxID=182803 RepID=A0A4Y2J075_ARAVE|nr:hypothetical protein AVEN_257430-1 [Araneus ventricosus]
MIETCGKKMIPVAVGDFILINVPKVDRVPLDCSNSIGIILKVENNAYQIGTKSGIIKSWFARCDFHISGVQILEDVLENLFVKLLRMDRNSNARGIASANAQCQKFSV